MTHLNEVSASEKQLKEILPGDTKLTVRNESILDLNPEITKSFAEPVVARLAGLNQTPI